MTMPSHNPPGSASESAAGVAAGVAPEAAAPERSDVEKSRSLAVLAYVGPLVLIPLLTSRQSPYARFHLNQGLMLLAGEALFVAAMIMGWVLIALMAWLLPQWGMLIALMRLTQQGLLLAAWVVFGIVSLRGIVHATNGEQKGLPLVGKHRWLKAGKGAS